MALSKQPYKGARDFYPEDKRIQKYMFGIMRGVVEQFGYEEYDAPILEPLALYKAKTGDEIVNEQTYNFTDRGGREVAIRPEMTPTVSRMVAAKRQELQYPLRWYSIPNLWRYERPQRGRLREHWQLNVDLFGIAELNAEHEVILVADSLMQAFGANRKTYTIRLNSRKLMDDLMTNLLGLEEVQKQSIARLIDRMHKLEKAEFIAQADAIMSPSQRDGGATEKLLGLLKAKSLEDLPEEFQGHESVLNLRKLLGLLLTSKITNAAFDITLMRGFDYYTDIVFEVFDNDPDNNRSMFGGGRYDGLVGLFGVANVPTVGFGMGDVTLQNFLESHGLLPKISAEVDLYAIIIGDQYPFAQEALTKLREMGLNVAADFSGRKIDKQIQSVAKRGLHYVVFMGEKEIAEGQFRLKHLESGKEETHSLERIASIIKDYRNTP